MTPAEQDAWVTKMWPYAVKVGEKLGVDPKLIIAQTALETGYGKSIPADVSGNSNNMFGIKAGGSWTGPSVESETSEYYDGVEGRERDRFRAYGSPEESADDYAKVLSLPRYAGARGAGSNADAFTQGLMKGGYATDSAYASKIKQIAAQLHIPVSQAEDMAAGRAPPPPRAPAIPVEDYPQDTRQTTYEQLFPEYANSPPAGPFDPIKLGRRFGGQLDLAKQRATTALDINGQDSNAFLNDLIARHFGDMPKPEGQTEWADVPKGFVSGIGSLATAGMGALEHLTNKYASDRNTGFEQGAGDVADVFTAGRHATEAFSKNWFESMTPEAQARSQRDILSLDPNKTIWQGGPREILSSMGLKMAQSAPSALVTILPSAIMMRVGLAGAISYLGASEAALSLGSIAANIAEEVEQAPEAQLMQAPRYAELRRQMGEQEARQQLIREAQGWAPEIGGLTVGAISFVTGHFFQPIITEGASGLMGRMARGYINEGVLEEAPQSAAEQIAQNWAAQTFDSSRGLFQGAGEAAAQGTVAGGPMGALVAGAVGRGPSPQQQPPAPTIPGQAAPPAAQSFEQVFGQPMPPPPPGGSGWRGGDIESGSNDQTPLTRTEIDPVTGKSRIIQQPDAREQPYSASGQRMMDLGPVDRDVQAALNIRRDRKMDDLFTPRPDSPEQQIMQQAGQINQQPDLFPQPKPPSPSSQRTLGLIDEQSGSLIRPTPMQGQPTDLSLPDAAASNPELARREALAARERRGEGPEELPAPEYPRPDFAAGTARDVRQRDMFPPDDEEPPPPPPGGPPGGQGPRSNLEGFTVTARTESGEVVSEATLPTAEQANALADQWGRALPQALINVQRTYSRAAGPALTETAPAELEDDEPTAEPMGYIRAQLEEMADPDSSRLGVYLSRANMARLEKIPVGLGVPLANFDGKGGTLIVKNRKIAEEVLRFRDSGAADMQEILGFVTGSGQGKPRGAQIVAQQRDEEGNVVRESLVATPEEADTLATQFEEPGRHGVVLSAEMALKRRTQRIAAEEAAEKERRAVGEHSQRVAETGTAVGVFPFMKDTGAHETASEVAKLRHRMEEAQKAQSDAPTVSARRKAHVTERWLRRKLSRLERLGTAVSERGIRKVQKRFENVDIETLPDEDINKNDLTAEQIEHLFMQAAEIAAGSRVSRVTDAEGHMYGGDPASMRVWMKEIGRKLPPSPQLTRYEKLLKLIEQINESLKAGENSEKFGDGVTDVPELARYKELLAILGRVNKTLEKNPDSKHWAARRKKVNAEIKALDIVGKLKARKAAAINEIKEVRKELDRPAAKDARTDAISIRLAPLKKRLKEVQTTLALVDKRVAEHPNSEHWADRQNALNDEADKLQAAINTAEDSGKLPDYEPELAEAGNKKTVGQIMGKERVPDKSVEQEALIAEADATSDFSMSGRTIEEIEAAHPTKSKKLQFILRTKRNMRIRAEGARTKTAPVTAEGKARVDDSEYETILKRLEEEKEALRETRKAHKETPAANESGRQAEATVIAYHQNTIALLHKQLKRLTKQSQRTPVRKTELNPTKAFDKEPPREMGREKRAAHRKRERKAYKALEKGINGFADKFTKIQRVLEAQSLEREGDGNPPHNARTAAYGKAYFKVLWEYGQMLQKAHPRSNAGLKEVERYNALIERLMNASPDQFMNELSNAMQAESEAQARAAIRVDPAELTQMNTREMRQELARERTKELEHRIAIAKVTKDKWHLDVKMNSFVAPLMEKLIGYFTNDPSLAGEEGDRRGLGYTPSFSEMRQLRYALIDYKQSNKPLYKVLKDWFKGFGYKFDKEGDLILAKNAAGKYVYQQPPVVLQASKEDLEDLEDLPTGELGQKKLQEAIDNAKMPDPSRRVGTPLNYIQKRNRMLQEQKIRDEAAKTNPKLKEKMTVGQRRAFAKWRRGELTTDSLQHFLMFGHTKGAMIQERARRSELTPLQRKLEDTALRDKLEQERRSRMTPEQRKAMEALERSEPRSTPAENITERTVREERQHVARGVPQFKGPFYAMKGGSGHYTGTRAAAIAIANHLEEASGRAVQAEDLLYALAAKLPAKHPYRPLVLKLLDVGLPDVIVQYSDTMTHEHWGEYSQYNTKKAGSFGNINLNRQEFERMRAMGEDPSAQFVNTLLHEMVHAVTMGALENNRALRATFTTLMRDSRAAADRQGFSLFDRTGYIHYGYRKMEVDEFVAEAFTNKEFQELLRKTKLEPKYSVWDKIVDTVKNFLGLSSTPETISVLDAVMAYQNQLFTGEFMDPNRRPTRGVKSMARVNDNYARTVAGNVFDRMMQTNRVTREIRERGLKRLIINKNDGPESLLSGVTMEQLRDMYDNSFDEEERNGIRKYMDAYFQRNAEISTSQELPSKLARRWTKQRVENEAKAMELSAVMTDATLYGIHPDKPLKSEENEHIKSDEQRERHAELSQRYRALGPDLHVLYNDLRKYYADTIRKQSNLITLNSLQAVLGDDMKYTEADIDRLKLNTVKGLKDAFGDKLTSDERKIIARLAKVSQIAKGPYFPLMRFGDFVVTAEKKKETRSFESEEKAREWAREQRENDPTLTVSYPVEEGGRFTVHVVEKETRMAETRPEAEKARQQLIEDYGAEYVDKEVQLKSVLYKRETMAASNAGLRSILSKLEGNPAAQGAIKEFYLRSIADSSFRKRESKRAKRRGVDPHMQHRTFANYSKAAAYYMAQLRHGATMSEGLKEMDQHAKAVAGGDQTSDASAIRLGQVVREIKARDDLTHDSAEVSAFVRRGTEIAQFMMLLSPSYWMINLTQPYMTSLPWLAARSSVTEATAALITAQNLIRHPITNQMTKSLGGLKALWSKQASEDAFSVLDNVLDRVEKRGGARSQEYLRMLENLKRHSIIDLSSTTELRDIAEGQNTGTWQKVMDASRIMSHLTEVNNRIMVALAAYDLSRNQGKTEAQAIEFAKQAVSLTQFNYSTANTSRLFSARGKLGPMGPLVFQFMKYPQHMYALLVGNFYKAVHGGQMERKVALKTLLGLFTTHLAAAGATGVMVQPVKWAIALAMMLFGGADDDEPYTITNVMSGAVVDRQIRKLTNALFGDNKLGEIAASGIPRGLGIDLSNRMSLGTLWMMDLKGDTAESMLGSVAGSVGGPTINLVMDAFTGYKYMTEGQPWKGAEAFMPKIMKDIVRMFRYSSEGLTNGAGMEIKGAEDLSPWQLFAQAMGFQPSDVAEGYARRGAMQDVQNYMGDRRQSILHRMNLADPEERAQIIAEDLSSFNKGNMNPITRSQLLRSMTKFKDRERRSKLYGLDLRRREMGLLKEAAPYDTDDDDESENQFGFEEAE